MMVTPVNSTDLAGAPRPDDSELLLARVRVAVAERYDGLREIGRGGMAVVYAARDRKLNRDIALKVLPPDLAFRSDVRERFVREAQTAARLNHPSIVPIYAVDEAEGLVYFAMALVQGESLATRLSREARPPLAFVRNVLAQVADALAYAHRSGVVHRDIKPDNILLEHATGRAIVTDFGIAHAVQSGARLTQTGIAVGTPAFMSPEQAMGQRDVDGRSDVYGLGVVGYVMLAGRLPFDAETSAGMLVQHVQGTPFPIANFRPDLPFSITDAITRAIAREPAARWPDAAAFAAALRAGDDDDRVGERDRAERDRQRAARALEQRAVRADAQHVGLARGAEPHLARYDAVAPGERQLAQARLQADQAMNRASTSLGESMERMNESLAYAGEQLRRSRGAVAPIEEPSDEKGISRNRRIAKFRMSVLQAGLLMFMLFVLNMVTSDAFPWFIFPSFGISLGLVGSLIGLGEHDIRLRDVIRGHMLDEPKPIVESTKSQRAREVLRDFKRRAKWVGISLLGSAAGLVGLAASGGEEGFLIPFLGGGALALYNGLLLTRDALRLRDVGLTTRDAIGESWQDKIAAMDDRPRSVRMAQETALLADPEVLRSPHGRVLREAVDDCTTIRETWAKLDPADRELVPDVSPTADALLERVSALVSNLARLDGAVDAHSLPSLEAKIAESEAIESPSVEAERRLSLLKRQYASLQELVERQDALQRQLESASLALRSLRLDVVKLRALGVGAAIGDVTSATQEARAISKDIGRALDVAEEMRRL
jgi:serine/threonine-protein kinase